jgi:hypothetical protein
MPTLIEKLLIEYQTPCFPSTFCGSLLDIQPCQRSSNTLGPVAGPQQSLPGRQSPMAKTAQMADDFLLILLYEYLLSALFRNWDSCGLQRYLEE